MADFTLWGYPADRVRDVLFAAKAWRHAMDYDSDGYTAKVNDLCDALDGLAETGPPATPESPPAAEPATPAPQCGDELPVSPDNHTYVCELPAGHRLPHREGRTVWEPATPAPQDTTAHQKTQAYAERIARVYGQDPAVGAMVAHILTGLEVLTRDGSLPDA